MEQLKLNMIPNGVNPVFHASQYDKGRQIRFVLDETLSSAEVTVSYRAKDGTEYGNVQMSVSGNTITDTIPNEVLTDYGIIEGEVSIDGIGSLNFFVEVEKDAYDGGDIVTQTASGAIATFETNIETAFASLTAEINPVQSGTGTPSPSNPRPISGFNALNVTRTGKNLLNGDTFASNFSGCSDYSKDTTNKTVTFSHAPGITEDLLCYVVKMPFEANTQYTLILSYEAVARNTSLRIFYTDGTSSYCDLLATTEKTPFSIVTTANKTIKYIAVGYWGAGLATLYYDECGIFEGVVTLADYEPYNGQTATVNFGQTVYGGVADVTNGKVTITHKIINLWDFNFTYNSGDATPHFTSNSAISDSKNPSGYGVIANILCSQYDNSKSWGSAFGSAGNNGYIALTPSGLFGISDDRYTSPSDFKTALQAENAKLVYELATPIEITTTPENLTALSGQTNNVYGDTNGDTEVKYYIEV